MSVCFVQPAADILKALSVGKVEHQNHALGVFVRGGGKSLEALLACRVPHLQFHHASSLPYRSYLEIHSDGGEQLLVENLLSEPRKKTGLANGGVADEKDLEDEVAALRMHGS